MSFLDDSPPAILSLLYTGQKLRLTFASERAAENYRKALYKTKKKQDEALRVLVGEIPRTLAVDKVVQEVVGFGMQVHMTFKLQDKTRAIDFCIIADEALNYTDPKEE